jgi:hypothetical protein
MTLDAPLKSAQRRADPVDMWTTLRLAHIPTGEQNQKKRTYDVLPKPDNFIRYRQSLPKIVSVADDMSGLGSARSVR